MKRMRRHHRPLTTPFPDNQMPQYISQATIKSLELYHLCRSYNHLVAQNQVALPPVRSCVCVNLFLAGTLVSICAYPSPAVHHHSTFRVAISALLHMVFPV
jgi:hypothetical protein